MLARSLFFVLAAAFIVSSSAALPPADTSDATAPQLTLTGSSSGVKPLPAAAFNDSVGVNTHLTYQTSPWDMDYAKWSSILLSSPIRHIRDQFCHYGMASTWCSNTWNARWNQIAAAGKSFDVVTDPWMGWTMATTGCNGGRGGCTIGYPANLGLASGSIEAYEGPNECNNNGGNCTDWGTISSTKPWPWVLANWSPLVSALATSSIKIYGPAAAYHDYSSFPSLAPYMNYGAIHDYTFPLPPESDLTATWISNDQTTAGSNPVVSTETGYATGPPYREYGGESRLAQERYTPRILFAHLNSRCNVSRTYLYELFDSPAGNAAQAFGLLDAGYKPKPAWTRLMQLMSYFTDAGVSAQTPLAYTLTGDTTGTLWQDLFQKSTGTYILVPWLGTLQWDWTTATDLAPTTETLTLTLPLSVRSVTMTRFADNGATTVTTLSGTNGKFSLPVSSLIEAVSFHT